LDESEVTCRGFVVSGGEASGAFEFVETTLDLIAQGIDEAVYRDLLRAVGARGDDRCAAPSGHHVADGIGIVALVRDDYPGRWHVVIQKGIEPFVIRHFSASDLRPQG